MFLKSLICVFFLAFYLSLINCKEKQDFKGCIALETLFKQICKEGGEKKNKIMSKASKCYVGMLPPDADKGLKDYFEKKCSNALDFCDQKVRDQCGPKAFEQMDEKQKESAMGFYEKHEKDFPKYCEVGLKCLHS